MATLELMHHDAMRHRNVDLAVFFGSMEAYKHRTFKQKYPSFIPARLVAVCFLLPFLPLWALALQMRIIGSGDECDRKFWPCLLLFTATAVGPWVISGTLERGEVRERSFALVMCMSVWTAAWLQFPAFAVLLGQHSSCHGGEEKILAVFVSGPMTSVLTVVIAIVHDWVRLRDVRRNMR